MIPQCHVSLSPDQIAQRAHESASLVASASRQQKDRVLLVLADLLTQQAEEVLAANQADLEAARQGKLAEHLLNRLTFGRQKLFSRVESLRTIAALEDPVGQPLAASQRPNELFVSRVRVPIGTILMIYEARPHVTLNAGALCLKAGNAAILRGGSEARRCNAILGHLWQQALAEADLPQEAIQVVSGSHEEIAQLLSRDREIDLVIPRGGQGLIRAVTAGTSIPVLKHLDGVCHLYVDCSASVEAAAALAVDSKCLMPEVCNALETLLIHTDHLQSRQSLEGLLRPLAARGVRLRVCPQTAAALKRHQLHDFDVQAAEESDWSCEYLDLVLAVRAVESPAAAIEHINTFGSHHTDVIATGELAAAEAFTAKVDSAVVLVNASTMFCDGASLGMGAEIGIATGRLHARGPMGLEELTTYKFVITGQNTVMGSA